eukprot:gene9693-10684_t
MTEASRNKALYGSERLADYNAVKDFNMKDNVLRKGDYHSFKGSDSDWETHYESMIKDSFQKYETVANENKQGTSQRKRRDPRVESTRLIGQDASRNFALTSRDYGEHKNRRSPAVGTIDKGTHIVDFSPKYHTFPTVSSSIYKSCYKQNDNLGDSYKDRLSTSKRTKEVRLTHFDLGTEEESLSTETKDSFKDCLYKSDTAAFEKKTLEMEKNKSLHRSNIFQSGDWNATNRSLAKRTVTTEQFREKKFADEANDSKNIPDYKKTHINFSKGNDLITSFYKQDFMIDKRNGVTRPEIAGPPPCSRVIQRNDVPIKVQSINRTDFLPLAKQSFEKSIMDEGARNKAKQTENNFSISQTKDRQFQGNLTTITKSIHHQPPFSALTLKHEKAPVTKYRYLDTDSALLKPRDSPYQSEVKANFRAPGDRISANPLERPKQDNSNHFSFGTDADGRTTEQNSQFCRPMKLDPRTTAAGVKDIGNDALESTVDKATGNGSCLQVRKNSDLGKDKSLSIMQNDYKPLDDRRFTSPQQRLIVTLAKYAPKIEPSHFFHMDNSHGPIASRTKMDFIPPDRGAVKLS